MFIACISYVTVFQSCLFNIIILSQSLHYTHFAHNNEPLHFFTYSCTLSHHFSLLHPFPLLYSIVAYLSSLTSICVHMYSFHYLWTGQIMSSCVHLWLQCGHCNDEEKSSRLIEKKGSDSKGIAYNNLHFIPSLLLFSILMLLFTNRCHKADSNELCSFWQVLWHLPALLH